MLEKIQHKPDIYLLDSSPWRLHFASKAGHSDVVCSARKNSCAAKLRCNMTIME